MVAFLSGPTRTKDELTVIRSQCREMCVRTKDADGICFHSEWFRFPIWAKVGGKGAVIIPPANRNPLLSFSLGEL